MKRGHRAAVVAEHPCGACVRAAPGPRTVTVSKILRADVALGVEEIRPELLGFGVVAYHLDPTDIGVSDTTVCGVDDKESAGNPFVDVARLYLEGWCVICRDRLTFSHPLADQ